MRIIGRNESGRIVGVSEPKDSTHIICDSFDDKMRVVSEAVVDGFREQINWLHGNGASRFECVKI